MSALPNLAALAVELLHLQAGEHRLVLAPSVGGSIASFHSQRGGQRVDWLRPATPAALAAGSILAMASFPLVPWCNRIRDGRASLGTRQIAARPNHPAEDSPHPLHGIGWLRPWEVLEVGEAHASLGLRVEADSEWPWRFRAVQRFDLLPERLECSISLTNLDSAPMPAGIGHHPYFPHLPGTRLQTHTRAMWGGDSEQMPTALRSSEEVLGLREGRLLADLDLDNNFTGWQRVARIDWPNESRGIELRAEAPLDHFVLYCPRGGEIFCAEPVSQCTDAINLAGRYPAADLGGSVLAPGETLLGHWSLTPTPP